MNPAPGANLLGPLHPGGGFIALLLALAVAGVGLHALILRRLGAERLEAWTGRIEGTLFCLVLGAMILLSALQVLLRNYFHGGVIWIDPLVRTLVLWLAFLGALTATSHARHLHIDVLHRSLPPVLGRRVTRVLSLGASVCCAWLADGAFTYLQEEAQHGQSPFLGVSSWVSQSILLWGFALLCYRFLVQAVWPAHVPPMHTDLDS